MASLVKDSSFGRCIFSSTLNKTLDLHISTTAINDVHEVSVFHNFKGEIRDTTVYNAAGNISIGQKPGNGMHLSIFQNFDFNQLLISLVLAQLLSPVHDASWERGGYVPRCHPDTRIQLIKHIIYWIDPSTIYGASDVINKIFVSEKGGFKYQTFPFLTAYRSTNQPQ